MECVWRINYHYQWQLYLIEQLKILTTRNIEVIKSLCLLRANLPACDTQADSLKFMIYDLFYGVSTCLTFKYYLY